MIQLNPPIPLQTPKGKGFAILVIDYSQEHDLLWVVADDLTGEIWAWPNDKVRMQENISLHRDLADLDVPAFLRRQKS